MCVFFVIGVNKLVYLCIRAACKKGIGVIGADCRPRRLYIYIIIGTCIYYNDTRHTYVCCR